MQISTPTNFEGFEMIINVDNTTPSVTGMIKDSFESMGNQYWSATEVRHLSEFITWCKNAPQKQYSRLNLWHNCFEKQDTIVC